MNKQVLLIGRNPMVLSNLASALADEGFSVTMTKAVEQASQEFNGTDFDLVAFGRGVDEAANAQLRADFLAQNPNLIFVDGLAPIISLLVQQIKQALAENLVHEKMLAEFTCQQADCLRVRATVTAACQLTIDLYQLDEVHNTRQKTLVSNFFPAGSHTFSIEMVPETNSTIKFLVAQANNRDLMVLPLR
ncbi:hypothetical protein [Spirosoma sp. KNUC1025]|uniref:hypothetical protein n=1 Tax=Spirosoma sp. KNUC1025 TaxID=2894082 RepID=UPI00386E7B5C|nr:hypothetical protein LN737_30230 [Spirosoma sp. KNUC1025]